MKKLLIIVSLAIAIVLIGAKPATSQVVISYKAQAFSGGIETMKFEGDSLSYSNGWLYVYKNGKYYTIEGITSITANSTEENRRTLKAFDEYQASILKKRCKNQAIGFFSTGAAMIFMGNIIADSYLDKKSDNLTIDDDWNKIRRNGKIIRYSFTGVGAFFEIIGISKTIKLVSGGSFGYGIKDNGVTLTYKIK